MNTTKKVTKVECWVTSDGKTFVVEADAVKHEKYLECESKYEESNVDFYSFDDFIEMLHRNKDWILPSVGWKEQ